MVFTYSGSKSPEYQVEVSDSLNTDTEKGDTDLRFARPNICGWEAQNEGLMKIMSKRSTAHFAFCNN
jgi:hypothetical protein